jgi:hypothetical protein
MRWRQNADGRFRLAAIARYSVSNGTMSESESRVPKHSASPNRTAPPHSRRRRGADPDGWLGLLNGSWMNGHVAEGEVSSGDDGDVDVGNVERGVDPEHRPQRRPVVRIDEAEVPRFQAVDRLDAREFFGVLLTQPYETAV